MSLASPRSKSGRVKLVLALMAAMFAVFGATLLLSADVATAQEPDLCADAVDNDGDGFVNDGCPAVGEAEAPPTPAPTEEPTAAPTEEPTAPPPDPTPEPTAEPEPSPTPNDLPPTGGPPGQDPGDFPEDPAATEWLAQQSGLGVLSSMIVLVLSVVGYSMTGTPVGKKVKIGAVFVITLLLTAVYASTKEGVEAKSLEDVWTLFIWGLGVAGTVWLTVARHIDTALTGGSDNPL